MRLSYGPWPGLAVALALLGAPDLLAQAGNRDCDPAVIDSVASNSPVCPGDPIQLSVAAHGDIIGYSWSGPGTGEFFTLEPEWEFPSQVLGQYTVVVFGMCGGDTAFALINAQGAGAGHDSTIQVCSTTWAMDLAPYLGLHAEGGTWEHNGGPHSGIYDPVVDNPGEFVYTSPHPATCPGSAPQATITVEEIDLGPDTTLAICQEDDAIDLEDLLPPGTSDDGDWYRQVFIALEPHSGVYDPAVDSSGTFRYTLGACFTLVTVVEDPYLPWYEDEDQDGFGDPGEVEWSCTQPEGHVPDSSDTCTELPGRAGDPCNDGLEATVNDSITPDCTCAGMLPTTLPEAGSGAVDASMWPNPFAGGELFLRTTIRGELDITVLDAAGRQVFTRRFAAVVGGRPISFQPGLRLSPGPYWVLVTSGDRTSALPLVVL